MKKQLLVITTFAALLLAGSPAFAGGKKAAAANAAPGANAEVKKARQENRAVLKQFDTNSDGTIDGAEKDALRAAFKDGKDAALKTYDTNTDGTLDDNEIAAIKAKGGGGKKGTGKAAKKESSVMNSGETSGEAAGKWHGLKTRATLAARQWATTLQ